MQNFVFLLVSLALLIGCGGEPLPGVYIGTYGTTRACNDGVMDGSSLEPTRVTIQGGERSGYEVVIDEFSCAIPVILEGNRCRILPYDCDYGFSVVGGWCSIDDEILEMTIDTHEDLGDVLCNEQFVYSAERVADSSSRER